MGRLHGGFQSDSRKIQQRTWSVLDTITNKSNKEILMLPPAKEDVFTTENLAKIRMPLVFLLNTEEIEIFLVHKVFHSVTFGPYTYGSTSSRHAKASITFAIPLEGSTSELAEIMKLIECVVRYRKDENIVTERRIYLVGVQWFLWHSCRLWFGNPVEVRSDMTTSTVSYIPISHLTSPAVYTHSHVDFGKYIGTQKVLVAVPVTN